MEYKFSLPATTQKRHTTALHLMAACLLLFIGIVSSVLYWFTNISGKFDEPFGPFAWFALASLGLGIFLTAVSVRRRKQGSPKNSMLLGVLELIALLGVTAALWFLGMHKPAIILLALTLLLIAALIYEYQKPVQSVIVVNEAGIQRPGRMQAYRWPEVLAVRYRAGVLSIESYGNKLWQGYVIPIDDFDVDAFLKWTGEKIAAAADARRKEW